MALTPAQEIQTRNLAVGTWTNQKGEKHVSLTRTGRYNKNIAIPVDMFPTVIAALQAEYETVTAGE
jgi:hypothetical protein